MSSHSESKETGFGNEAKYLTILKTPRLFRLGSRHVSMTTQEINHKRIGHYFFCNQCRPI